MCKGIGMEPSTAEKPTEAEQMSLLWSAIPDWTPFASESYHVANLLPLNTATNLLMQNLNRGLQCCFLRSSTAAKTCHDDKPCVGSKLAA